MMTRYNLTDHAIEEMELYDLFRLAERLLDSRQPSDAVRALRRVVDSEPANPAAWELIGRAYFAAALLKPAEDAFRRLVDLQPANGWAHIALARALDRQSRHEEANTYHRMAAALDA